MNLKLFVRSLFSIGLAALMILFFQNCSSAGETKITETGSMAVPTDSSNNNGSQTPTEMQKVDYSEIAEVEFLTKSFINEINDPVTFNVAESTGNIEFKVNRLESSPLMAESYTYEIRATKRVSTGGYTLDNADVRLFLNQKGAVTFAEGENSKTVQLQVISAQDIDSTRPILINRMFLLKITKGETVVADRLIKVREIYVENPYQSGPEKPKIVVDLVLNPVRFYSVKVDENKEQQTCRLCFSLEVDEANDPNNNKKFLDYDLKKSSAINLSAFKTVTIKGKLEKDYEYGVVRNNEMHLLRTSTNSTHMGANNIAIDIQTRQFTIKISESNSGGYLGVFDLARACGGSADCNSNYQYELNNFYQLITINQ